MNRLNITNLTQELLVGPAFNILKGTCKSLKELEYHFKECSKATTERLDWHNPEGKPYPFYLRKPLPLIPDHRGSQQRMSTLENELLQLPALRLRSGASQSRTTNGRGVAADDRSGIRFAHQVILVETVPVVHLSLKLSRFRTKKRSRKRDSMSSSNKITSSFSTKQNLTNLGPEEVHESPVFRLFPIRIRSWRVFGFLNQSSMTTRMAYVEYWEAILVKELEDNYSFDPLNLWRSQHLY
ncbi:hypothetical protein Tco_0386394 [Tanacetum coccineum]